MAPQSALMPASVNLLASAHTSRYWGLAMNGRLSLGFSTRAEEWLCAHPPARFAESEMAEGATLMLAARESLLARLETQVTAERVSDALFDRTADLFALVLLTRL